MLFSRRFFPAMLAVTGAGLLATVAHAQVIGLAAPLSGPTALLGEQMRAGANAGLAIVPNDDLTLKVEDDLCTAEGGQAAAQAFVEARVAMVVGFLCTEALTAALPALAAANIPVVTPGVRTNSLTDDRERTGWPIYRLAPRDDAEREAINDRLLPLWRSSLFAIVDDGTIYGRELAESFREAAEATGLKPVFIDNYRPQLENQVGLVGRLRRAGATHAFVGGDREDVAIIGRDAAQIDYSLQLAGGEALRAATLTTDPVEGTLMVAPPDWSQAAQPETLQQLSAAGIEPEGYVVPSFAAIEIAAGALRDRERSDQPLAQILDDQTFSTAMGEIQFDEKGDLTVNPYRLYRFEAGEFVEVLP
ncbi:MAG TPA: branched-chain amino acid ABC transporter substrate-binding protein [Tianweitania sediminis]|nr:branched-chain amino acid ABC transporter substrate-binding protein [Tianweitania sediminis]